MGMVSEDFEKKMLPENREKKRRKRSRASWSLRRPLSFLQVWLALGSCEGRQTLSLTSWRERKKKAKKKSIRTQETWLLQGTWAYRDIWLMRRHFCDFQWVWCPSACFPSPSSLQQISLSTYASQATAGTRITVNKGETGLCPSSLPGTTNSTHVFGCHSTVRKPYLPSTVQNPSGKNSVARF